MFSDQSILHEYGHHLQRMNDTYALWPAVHDGCLAGTATSTGFAWFEGFPSYFSIVAGRSSDRVNDITPWPMYYPAGSPSPHTVPSGTCTNPRPKEIEDYVTSLLLDLVEAKNISPSPHAPALSRAELEARVVSIWFRDMRGARAPGTKNMPTVDDFETAWNASFPASNTLTQLMHAYGM